MIAIIGIDGHVLPLEVIERRVLVAALDYYTEMSITEIAKRLKISRSTLYRKVEEYHIDISENIAAYRNVRYSKKEDS